jgi:hypothetical protein
MSLFPREHGAYGQMIVPLITSLLVGGVTAPALLLVVAVVAGFLAHEPLLILLGRRGPRMKREQGREAAMWLATAGAAGTATALAGVSSMPPGLRVWLLLPLVPAALLAIAIAANREKHVVSEIAVALAFSLAAVPVGLAAGAAVSVALAVGVAFAAIFASGTLAVRVVILGVRGGGNPRAVRTTRLVVLGFAVAVVLGLVVVARLGLLPWTTLLAAAPGLLGASWLAMFPPPATRLRTIGWTLVTTSAAAALMLLVGAK